MTVLDAAYRAHRLTCVLLAFLRLWYRAWDVGRGSMPGVSINSHPTHTRRSECRRVSTHGSPPHPPSVGTAATVFSGVKAGSLLTELRLSRLRLSVPIGPDYSG
jgi:hypothetical protein